MTVTGTNTADQATHTKLAQVLAALEAAGTDKVRQRNARLGSGANQFGTRMGDVRKVAGRHGRDHELALALWETGNLEARLVATLVVRPQELSATELSAWVAAADFPQLADWLNSHVVKAHPAADAHREAWMESPDAWTARAGWSLTAGRVARDPAGLDLPALLARLERDLAAAPTPAQWTMNACLAAIGIHHPEHRRRAAEIGEAVGLYRDYPVSKGCVSPFAPIWISEIVSRAARPGV